MEQQKEGFHILQINSSFVAGIGNMVTFAPADAAPEPSRSAANCQRTEEELLEDRSKHRVQKLPSTRGQRRTRPYNLDRPSRHTTRKAALKNSQPCCESQEGLHRMVLRHRSGSKLFEDLPLDKLEISEEGKNRVKHVGEMEKVAKDMKDLNVSEPEGKKETSS